MKFLEFKKHDDKDFAKYEAKVRAGSEGGKSKAENSKAKQTVAESSKPQQDTAKDTQLSIINNQLSTINNNIGDKSPKRKTFVKPTIEQVTEYCESRGNKVNPQKWFAYYESNGWMVGRNHMKDWQACVRHWEQNGYNAPSVSRFDKMQISNIDERDNNYTEIAKNLPDPLAEVDA